MMPTLILILVIEIGLLVVMLGVFLFYVHKSLSVTDDRRHAILVEDAGARKRADVLDKRVKELQSQMDTNTSDIAGNTTGITGKVDKSGEDE
jgi:hypothetical protein